MGTDTQMGMGMGMGMGMEKGNSRNLMVDLSVGTSLSIQMETFQGRETATIRSMGGNL